MTQDRYIFTRGKRKKGQDGCFLHTYSPKRGIARSIGTFASWFESRIHEKIAVLINSSETSWNRITCEFLFDMFNYCHAFAYNLAEINPIFSFFTNWETIVSFPDTYFVRNVPLRWSNARSMCNCYTAFWLNIASRVIFVELVSGK